MKLYEVNRAINALFDQMVDPETGEVLVDCDALLAQLHALQMERTAILSYLAKLVLNYRADQSALKEEEKRLKERRTHLENKEARLMQVLDRECAGETTDCGVATFRYRKTEHIEIGDPKSAIAWLGASGHADCYRIPDPEISKTEVKKLVKSGCEVPGIVLVQGYACGLK